MADYVCQYLFYIWTLLLVDGLIKKVTLTNSNKDCINLLVVGLINKSNVNSFNEDYILLLAV